MYVQPVNGLLKRAIERGTLLCPAMKDHFYALAPHKKGADRMMVYRVRWRACEKFCNPCGDPGHICRGQGSSERGPSADLQGECLEATTLSCTCMRFSYRMHLTD